MNARVNQTPLPVGTPTRLSLMAIWTVQLMMIATCAAVVLIVDCKRDEVNGRTVGVAKYSCGRF